MEHALHVGAQGSIPSPSGCSIKTKKKKNKTSALGWGPSLTDMMSQRGRQVIALQPVRTE